MKKLYTLALSLLLGAGAFAQVDETFVFADAAGNIVPNGTTLTVHNYELDDFTEEVMFPSGLFVKNNSAGNAYASMKLDISKIDNGKLQHCFPGSCMIYDVPNAITRNDVAAIKAGESKSIQSEWIPATKGSCSVTYTIRLMTLTKPMPPTYGEQSLGASVTVNFVYDDESKDAAAGIEEVSIGNAVKTHSTYNLSGQKVASGYKGIAIRNGKKYMLK